MKRPVLGIIVILLINNQITFATPGIENIGIFKVTEDNWIYYTNEPLKHFRLAYQHLQHKDFELSIHELRQSIAYLVLETLRDIPDKEELTQTIHHLDELATNLEKGKSISQENYNITFTNANYILSRHYRKQARKSLENEKPRRVGYALQASVGHLEQAADLSGYEFDEDEKLELEESKHFHQTLINTPQQVNLEKGEPKINILRRISNKFKLNMDSGEITRPF